MVELADTLVLGTSASAWGFDSLSRHMRVWRNWQTRLAQTQLFVGSTPTARIVGIVAKR